ncbi:MULTISPECIES: dihydrodipicolinate synthase family protein [Halocynthiibacter]|uniref:Dihydrodipicolinate synthase family protein n=1 Tax=Halocynthiibacter halioticoli TaxID=2986804 RepID=A0AAE3LRY2_9RHOB|nr:MULTISPECIES: dihydrodipicolinate synthase family protein [Halocynthiibacter]MCV6824954.1 dihydrodipicolinate synthase family protein [Halocynthiibacter halioticoli]MCW4057955.1 dihydrodipicolinate synthase family protein [Halocynthiibacter sp. SDUM655004]
MSGLTGIVPILLTPFDSNFDVDFGSLRIEVDATLNTGVSGIGIAIGSEIFKLTPKERREVLRAVVDQVDGRVPVVMNTSAPGTAPAVQLAAEAAEAGASRLMIWPPDFFATGPDSVIEHLSAVAEAAQLPIILQDVPQSPISPALALKIAEEVPLVDTIKVETNPTVAQVSAMVDVVGDKLTVLGGAGGGTLIEEHRRGARGTMPFASQAGVFMAVWRALEAGDEGEAAAILEECILPVSRLGFQGADMFYHVHKTLLCQANVFRSPRVRPPTAKIDDVSQAELEQLLKRLNTQKVSQI